MTDEAMTPAAPPAAQQGGTMPWRKVGILVVLVVAADWLLFRRPLGLSVVVFLVALATASAVAAPRRAGTLSLLIAAGILFATLVPVLLAPTILSVMLAGLATAHFALVAGGHARGGLVEGLAGVAAMFGQVPWRLPADVLLGVQDRSRRPSTARRGLQLLTWVVPLGLGAVFLLLFKSANPVIDDWIGDLPLREALRQVEPVRILFWLLVLGFVWPFVAVKLRTWVLPRRTPAGEPDTGDAEASLRPWERHLMGRSAVLRSLLLFNLIFAVQTALDLVYLWGGAALPEGMSLAAYAHRGAYPLVATALLAAAFVLVAMRPGGPAEESRAIRGLVFLWVGQNVLLVASAMLRLDLYVAVYSLTHLRIAAFVWMLLVAVGLVLIVVRIALARSNRWLVSANLAALVLTLWLCGFVNIPALIADYNVDQSREMGGEGAPLDVEYLAFDLGPQALPALDRFWTHVPETEHDNRDNTRARLVRTFDRTLDDWRSWNLYDLELAAYVAASRSFAEPLFDEPISGEPVLGDPAGAGSPYGP